MLYLLYGSDFKKTRKNLRSLVDGLLKRKPNSNVFSLTEESFSPDKLEEFVGSRGLFAERYIVVLDNCFREKGAKEEILKSIKRVSESENVFIIVEESLDTPTFRKIEKYAEKVKEYGRPSVEKKDKTFFDIADALGNRDRKCLWTLYQKALLSGATAEELHGILIWQIKSMILARDSDGIDESGLKPFVYEKSKRFLVNYDKEELDNIYSKLVHAYHMARRGGGSLGGRVEEILLYI